MVPKLLGEWGLLAAVIGALLSAGGSLSVALINLNSAKKIESTRRQVAVTVADLDLLYRIHDRILNMKAGIPSEHRVKRAVESSESGNHQELQDLSSELQKTFQIIASAFIAYKDIFEEDLWGRIKTKMDTAEDTQKRTDKMAYQIDALFEFMRVLREQTIRTRAKAI